MSGRSIPQFALAGLLAAALAAPATAQQPPVAPMPRAKPDLRLYVGYGSPWHQQSPDVLVAPMPREAAETIEIETSFGIIRVKLGEAGAGTAAKAHEGVGRPCCGADCCRKPAAADHRQLFNFAVGLFGADAPAMPLPAAPTLGDLPLPSCPPCPLPVIVPNPLPGTPLAGTWYRDTGVGVIAVTFARDEMKMWASQRDGAKVVTLTLTAHYSVTTDGLVYGAVTGADVDVKHDGKADPGIGMELAELSLLLQELADRPFSFRAKPTSAGLMVSQLKAASFEGLGRGDFAVFGGLYKCAKDGKVPTPAPVKADRVGRCDSGYNPADYPAAGPTSPYPTAPLPSATAGEPVQRVGIDFSTNPPTMSAPLPRAGIGFSTEYSSTPPAGPACADPMKSMAADAFGQMLWAAGGTPPCLEHPRVYSDPGYPERYAHRANPAPPAPFEAQPACGAAAAATKPGAVGTWFREIGAKQCVVTVAADHLTVTVSEARELDGKTGTMHFTLTADYHLTRDGLTAVGLITSADMKFDGDLPENDAEGLLEHLGALQKALEDKPFAMTFRVYGDVLAIGNVRLPAIGDQLDTEPGAYIGGRYKAAGDKPLPKLKAVKCQPQPACVPPALLGAPGVCVPPGIYNGPALIGGPYGPGVGNAAPPGLPAPGGYGSPGLPPGAGVGPPIYPGVYAAPALPPGLVFPPGSSYPQAAPSGDLLPPQTLPCPTGPRPASGWVIPTQPRPVTAEGGLPPLPATMSEPVAPEPTMPEPIPPAVSAEPKPEVGASWTPRVTFLPDPTRGGAPGAGLSGTVLLPAGGCGTLTVELADDTPPVYGRRPAVVERWQFDKGTLGKLRTDAGYALFLPWSGYSPDVTRVRLAVRFDSEDGNTLLLPAAAVALARPEPVAAPTPQMAEPAKPELQPRTDAAPPVKPGKKPKKAKPADPLVRVQSVIDQSEDLRRVREEVATRAADYRQLFNFGSGLFGSQ